MFLAACYLSLLSSHAFPFWFPSLADCCALFALSCLLLAFTFYHLTVHYSLVNFCCYLLFTGRPLFAVCFLLLAACLFFSYLAALTVSCSLFPSSLITSQLLLLGVASRRPLIAERSSRIVPRYSLCDTRFSPLTSPHSVAAGSLLFDLLYCSLPSGHSSLVASNIMFLITRSSLKIPAILYTRSAFRCSVLVFPSSFPAARFLSLLVSWAPLTYSAFSSLVVALYSMLGTGRNQPIFASRCSLMAIRGSWLCSLISACYFHLTSHDSQMLLCCSLSKAFPVFVYLLIRVLSFEGLSPEIFNTTYRVL